MQPDITVACDYKTTIDEKGRYMGVPSLVVEILSTGTKSRDMVDKLNTYMLSGVKEYWIIDNKKKRVHIYNFKDFGVDEMRSFNFKETAVSFYFEGLICNTGELFELD